MPEPTAADYARLLHFRSAPSGVAGGDEQACVKGQWVDELGLVHSFFGCDVITTVPQ